LLSQAAKRDNVKFKVGHTAKIIGANPHQKQHFFLHSRNHRAMKTPTPKLGAIPLTIRVSPELHQKLVAAAAEQGWTVNAEINHRLRAGPILEQLRSLTAEVARLRAIIEDQ
jgi:predicted HicB family RNase H-like nuclease